MDEFKGGLQSPCRLFGLANNVRGLTGCLEPKQSFEDRSPYVKFFMVLNFKS
jgi:hypothetical protein